jgi:hypothetical protein
LFGVIAEATSDNFCEINLPTVEITSLPAAASRGPRGTAATRNISESEQAIHTRGKDYTSYTTSRVPLAPTYKIAPTTRRAAHGAFVDNVPPDRAYFANFTPPPQELLNQPANVLIARTSTQEQDQATQVQAEEAQAEVVHTEEVQAEEVQAEEVQAEEAQEEDVQVEQIQAKQDLGKQDQAEEIQTEQFQTEQDQAEQIQARAEHQVQPDEQREPLQLDRQEAISDPNDQSSDLISRETPLIPSEMSEFHKGPRPEGLKDDFRGYILKAREFQEAVRSRSLGTLNLAQDERAFLRWSGYGERFFGDNWRDNPDAACLLEHISDNEQDLKRGMGELMDDIEPEQQNIRKHQPSLTEQATSLQTPTQAQQPATLQPPPVVTQQTVQQPAILQPPPSTIQQTSTKKQQSAALQAPHSAPRVPSTKKTRDHNMFDRHQRKRMAQQGYVLFKPVVDTHVGMFAWAQADGVFNFLLANAHIDFGIASLQMALEIIPDKQDLNARTATQALFNPAYFAEELGEEGSWVRHSGAVLLGRYTHLRLLDLPNHPKFGPSLAYTPVVYKRGKAMDPETEIIAECIFDFSTWSSQRIADLISREPLRFADGKQRVIHPSGAAVIDLTQQEDPILALERAYNNELALEVIPAHMRDAQVSLALKTISSQESARSDALPAADGRTHRSLSVPQDYDEDQIWPHELSRDLIVPRTPSIIPEDEWRTAETLCTEGLLQEEALLEVATTRIIRSISRCRSDILLLRSAEEHWYTEEYIQCRIDKANIARCIRREGETDGAYAARQLSAIRRAVRLKNNSMVDVCPAELVHLIDLEADQRIGYDALAVSFSVFRRPKTVGKLLRQVSPLLEEDLNIIRRCERILGENGVLPLKVCTDPIERFDAVRNYYISAMTDGATDESGFDDWKTSRVLKNHVALRATALAIRDSVDDSLLRLTIPQCLASVARMKEEYAQKHARPAHFHLMQNIAAPASAVRSLSRAARETVQARAGAGTDPQADSHAREGPASSATPDVTSPQSKQLISATTSHHNTSNSDQSHRPAQGQSVRSSKTSTLDATPVTLQPPPAGPLTAGTLAPLAEAFAMAVGRGEPRQRADGSSFNTAYDHTRTVGTIIQPVTNNSIDHDVQNGVATYDCYASLITRNRTPPDFVKLTDNQAAQILINAHNTSDGIPVAQLSKRWPLDFNSAGLIQPGRRQKGLPAIVWCSVRQRYCYVKVKGVYTLLGGGHLEKIYAAADDVTKARLDNINAREHLFEWKDPVGTPRSYKEPSAVAERVLTLTDNPPVDWDAIAGYWPRSIDVDRYDQESEAFRISLPANRFPADIHELVNGSRKAEHQLWGTRQAACVPYEAGLSQAEYIRLAHDMPLAVYCMPADVAPPEQVASADRPAPAFPVIKVSARPLVALPAHAAPAVSPTAGFAPAQNLFAISPSAASPSAASPSAASSTVTPALPIYPLGTTHESIPAVHPSSAFTDLQKDLVTQGTFAHSTAIDAATQAKNAADNLDVQADQLEATARGIRATSSRLRRQAQGHLRVADAIKNFTVEGIEFSSVAHVAVVNAAILPELCAVQPARSRIISGFTGDSAAGMLPFVPSSKATRDSVLPQEYFTPDEAIDPTLHARTTLNSAATKSAFEQAEARLSQDVATLYLDESSTPTPSSIRGDRRVSATGSPSPIGSSLMPPPPQPSAFDPFSGWGNRPAKKGRKGGSGK